MSAAPLPPERLAEIVASLPPHPAPGTLVRGLHETVAEIGRLTTKLDRSEAESRMWRGTAWAEANTVWSSELPPGGLVCADPECGQPVESEPCEEHNPRAVAERLTARVAELETERHSTNEALSEATEQLAARTFYLADVEGIDGGPTLHTTVDAAKAWVESVNDEGDWFEQDGVWEQWHCDLDTDRPTSRGDGSVLPLVVQGDGIVAEAERLRQELLAHAPQAAILRQVRDSQADEIRRMRAEQDAVRVALGCEDDDDWDDVVHRVKRLTGAQGGAV